MRFRFPVLMPRPTQTWRRPLKVKVIGLAAVGAAVSAISPIAPHSFGKFRGGKVGTLEGTAKEFQWTNPHSGILMMVNNAQGEAQQWAIEMGGPAGLARQGWKPKTLTPGMKVQTVIHPLRDGANGGQFMAITLPDRNQIGNAQAPPSADARGGPGPPATQRKTATPRPRPS